MGDAAEQVFARAMQLPEDERATLVVRLLDAVGEDEETVAAAWRVEARRRVAELARGEVDASDWAEARKRIFAR
jgi:putative addiction module component (TIGR02574 family)